MKMTQVRVLLVEDSPSDAQLIQYGLLQHNPGAFEVAAVDCLDEALRNLAEDHFDVVLLDLGLPDCSGLEAVDKISAAKPRLPIVVLTGAEDEDTALEAIRRGGQDYLVKGHADGQIVANAIRYAIERKNTEIQLKNLNEDLERRVAERTAVAEGRAEQLRKLSAELTLAEHRERQRLALILHDGLQQLLVAAKLNLVRLRRTSDPEDVEVITGLLDEAIETSRSLTWELSPPMLRDGGLLSAMKWLAKWFSEKHGLTVQLNSGSGLDAVPEAVVVLLFQSIRELLFNIVKHAGIQTAEVHMAQRDGRILVSISDQGRGFDPGRLESPGKASGGFGLFSINERLSFLGGKMEITSAPGQGSRFSLSIPYTAGAARSAFAKSV